jgi:hypothetical protein
MSGYADSPLIRSATLVLAILVIYRFFSWWDKKKRPQYETVHVATADEMRELSSSGLAVAGRVVDIQAPGSTNSSKRTSMPPIFLDLTPLLITAITHFLLQVLADPEWRTKRDDQVEASPPIRLSRSSGPGTIPLLFEFDLEQDGAPRTYRGAHFFTGAPYHAIEMVGKEVTVRYLPHDPSISTLDASALAAYS